MLHAGLRWVNGYVHWFTGRKETSKSQTLQSASNSLLVAAIDFGTTYSGWAFLFKHDFKTDPTKICVKEWHGSGTTALTVLKCPTCVLIKPDGKTMDTFGFEAETQYSTLCQNGEHTKWYYFQRFKMMLWNKRIHKDTMLHDECGKSLPALTVFSLSIRFMMDGLINMSKLRISGLNEGDIHWVLTVPAIWDDSAKHFMRLAAQEAGIAPEKLTIALEPEAASIYCRYRALQKDGESDISSFRYGKKYLVLDAGGGTIDVTVHEVCDGGELKELYKATGGAWGGTVVDKAFLDFMGQLIGKDILDKFKKEHMDDFIELLRNFEVKKRETGLKSDRKVTIRIPVAISHLLDEKGQKLEQIIQNSPNANKISLVREKLLLDFDFFQSFFMGSVDNILQHLSSLLRKPETLGVETILMVGGYSESPFLREAIGNRFPTMKIIVPQDAGLAVLKGAVIFGHCPTSIKERVSKYTYGFRAHMHFDETKHPLEKRKLADIGYQCKDIFYVLIRSDQSLVVGENQFIEEVCNIHADATAIPFKLFRTSQKDVTFVTDDGCKQIGFFEVPLSGSGLERYVIVRIMFGGTEIIVECEEKSTGRKTKYSIDFLQ